jgi:hypothetical protein
MARPMALRKSSRGIEMDISTIGRNLEEKEYESRDHLK